MSSQKNSFRNLHYSFLFLFHLCFSILSWLVIFCYINWNLKFYKPTNGGKTSKSQGKTMHSETVQGKSLWMWGLVIGKYQPMPLKRQKLPLNLNHIIIINCHLTCPKKATPDTFPHITNSKGKAEKKVLNPRFLVNLIFSKIQWHKVTITRNDNNVLKPLVGACLNFLENNFKILKWRLVFFKLLRLIL